jgi:hypothetical protein
LAECMSSTFPRSASVAARTSPGSSGWSMGGV